MSKSFNFGNLKNKIPIIRDRMKEIIQTWEQEGKIGNNKNFNACSEMKRITGEIALRSFFGSRFSNKKIGEKYMNNEIADIFSDVFKYSISTVFFIKAGFLG